MTYLHDPNARALRSVFADTYAEYANGTDKADKTKPIKKEDTAALKEALAAAGITEGKKLGAEVLHLTERRGQQLYKDLTQLSVRQLWRIQDYCSKALADAKWDVEVIEIINNDQSGAYYDRETQDEAAQKAARLEKAYSFFSSYPTLRANEAAGEELEARALLDGIELLCPERRRSLLLTLQGLLMAEYRRPGQTKDEVKRAQRSREICTAINKATIDNSSNLTALALLVEGGRVNDIMPEFLQFSENEPSELVGFYDRVNSKNFESPEEAVLREYVGLMND